MENGQKGICQGKHREFGNFAKSQGIMFAQVVHVNSLILKVKDIGVFATKIFIFSRSRIGLSGQFCVCNSHKSDYVDFAAARLATILATILATRWTGNLFLKVGLTSLSDKEIVIIL